MSFIQNFFTSRDNNANTETYVGQTDRLWYNPDTNSIRVSDGSTPGGLVVDLETNANATFNTITANSGTINGNLTITGNISPATANTIGGIYPGPGVVISNTGELTIDTANLPLSFGNFTATDNILSIVNVDEDMILETQGNASVDIRGAFNIYTNSDLGNAVFSVNSTGDVNATTLNIVNPADLELMAPLNVTINEDGLTRTPTVISGSVAQFTGRDARQPAILVDSYGEDINLGITGGQLVFRAGQGTNATPIPVEANDRLGAIAAAGWASNGYAGVDSARVGLYANENFTTTARGGRIEMQVVTNGTVTRSTVATFTSTGMTGNVTGLLTRSSRDAGTIADGGTLTINVATDDIVYCVWNNGMTMAYSNIVPGRVVKVMATKGSGSGTDNINLDGGITAAQTSTGSVTVASSADKTVFLEYISTTALIGGMFVNIS